MDPFAKGIEGTYSVEANDGSFELTMTDEFRVAMKSAVDSEGNALSFHDIRALVMEEIGRIEADTHGKTNIDHFRDTDAGRKARLVHAVEGHLADIVPGKKLAVKRTGLDQEYADQYLGARRARLPEQFRNTLRLQRLFAENFPETDGLINGTVGVNEVYGVLKYQDPETEKPVEWMLMERVENAIPVENVGVTMASLGAPETQPGFSRQDHPELAKIVDGQGNFTRLRDVILFRELSGAIMNTLGTWSSSNRRLLEDLNGNNILVSETLDGERRYTIIDIQSH